MLSIIMAVDITLQFCFVYAGFEMPVYLLSVPTGKESRDLSQEGLKTNSICFRGDSKGQM